MMNSEGAVKINLPVFRWLKQLGHDPLTFVILVWAFLFLMTMAFFLITD